MNVTPATMDREDTYPSDQNGRGRHAHPVSENSAGRGRHTRPSRIRRYLIGVGVAVVGGAAVVVGLMATSSPTANPAVPSSPGTHSANPAVPSRPNANPAVPSRPNANPAVPSQPGAQTANPAVPATPGTAS
jgi:hypothetical protein